MDTHSYFADSDEAVFLRADPDPEGKQNADPYGSGSTALEVSEIFVTQITPLTDR